MYGMGGWVELLEEEEGDLGRSEDYLGAVPHRPNQGENVPSVYKAPLCIELYGRPIH